LGRLRQQKWDINQGISDEEIKRDNLIYPLTFKACGSDGISNGIL